MINVDHISTDIPEKVDKNSSQECGHKNIFDYTLEYVTYGALGGALFTALATSVAMMLYNPGLGIAWLGIAGCMLLAVKYPPAVLGAIAVSILGEGNLFISVAAILAAGLLAGVPFGMIAGTFTGHCKRVAISKGSPVGVECRKQYTLGIIVPVVTLMCIVKLYVAINDFVIDCLVNISMA